MFALAVSIFEIFCQNVQQENFSSLKGKGEGKQTLRYLTSNVWIYISEFVSEYQFSGNA